MERKAKIFGEHPGYPRRSLVLPHTLRTGDLRRNSGWKGSDQHDQRGTRQLTHSLYNNTQSDPYAAADIEQCTARHLRTWDGLGQRREKKPDAIEGAGTAYSVQ